MKVKWRRNGKRLEIHSINLLGQCYGKRKSKRIEKRKQLKVKVESGKSERVKEWVLRTREKIRKSNVV